MKLYSRVLGEGQPLLIVHGLFGMSDNWQTLAKQFAAFFEVHLIDLPNHGRSPHIDEFSYSYMSEYIKEYISDSNLENVIIIGHSLGGKLAMQLAVTVGGVYSQLSETMQGARLARLIQQMKRAGQIPPWPDGLVEPVVLTGMEALGREQDVNKVQTALQFLQGMPPEMMKYIKMDVLLGKAFHGLDLPDAVRNQEEVQEEEMQQARQQAMSAGAQSAASQAGMQGAEAVVQQAMSQQ